MCNWPSKDSFTSTLAKQDESNKLIAISVLHQQPEHREVYIVSEVEDEREPAPLASKKVSNGAFE
jgi:hypothetical protein